MVQLQVVPDRERMLRPLASLIEDTMEIVAPRIHKKKIEVSSTILPQVPSYLRGDPDQAKRIVESAGDYYREDPEFARRRKIILEAR